MRGSEIGYILYSDMTRSKDLDSSKTPIGVVVCSYADGSGEAIALNTVGDLYTWGEGDNISSFQEVITAYEASQDLGSCKNTSKPIAAGNKSIYPAAWAAHEYKTEGTSIGDWCLPAAGIFVSYYNNQQLIDTSMVNAGGTVITSSYVWSSSGSDTYGIWVSGHRIEKPNNNCNIYFSGANLTSNTNHVRPVIPFCQEGYKYDYTSFSCKEKEDAKRAEWGKCNGYAKTCNIGDIVYSDGTCVSYVIPDKTPIAVIVYKSADGNCAQAIALKPIGRYSWSDEFIDLSLKNFTTREDASTDYQICANTMIITDTGDKSLYPAAWAAEEYSTEGTKAGDWCLPAAGIMTSIKNNALIINISIMDIVHETENNEVGSSTVQVGGEDERYWTSTEQDRGAAWISFFESDYGLESGINKHLSYYDVRPVIEF